MLEQPDEAAEILDRADQHSLAFAKVAGDSLRPLAKYSLKSDIRSKHHPPNFSHFQGGDRREFRIAVTDVT